MRIALFADIHANRQAFSACLDHARAQGAERIVCLGDYVGYGADPEWAVTTVMDLVDQGAVAVLGNHDNAIGNPREHHEREAQVAIEWTRGELSAAQRHFLAELAVTRQRRRSALRAFRSMQPAGNWRYVPAPSEAARSIAADPAHHHVLRPRPPAGHLFRCRRPRR